MCILHQNVNVPIPAGSSKKAITAAPIQACVAEHLAALARRARTATKQLAAALEIKQTGCQSAHSEGAGGSYSAPARGTFVVVCCCLLLFMFATPRRSQR